MEQRGFYTPGEQEEEEWGKKSTPKEDKNRWISNVIHPDYISAFQTSQDGRNSVLIWPAIKAHIPPALALPVHRGGVGADRRRFVCTRKMAEQWGPQLESLGLIKDGMYTIKQGTETLTWPVGLCHFCTTATYQTSQLPPGQNPALFKQKVVPWLTDRRPPVIFWCSDQGLTDVVADNPRLRWVPQEVWENLHGLRIDPRTGAINPLVIHPTEGRVLFYTRTPNAKSDPGSNKTFPAYSTYQKDDHPTPIHPDHLAMVEAGGMPTILEVLLYLHPDDQLAWITNDLKMAVGLPMNKGQAPVIPHVVTAPTPAPEALPRPAEAPAPAPTIPQEPTAQPAQAVETPAPAPTESLPPSPPAAERPPETNSQTMSLRDRLKQRALARSEAEAQQPAQQTGDDVPF